jgi:hypothetical protein
MLKGDSRIVNKIEGGIDKLLQNFEACYTNNMEQPSWADIDLMDKLLKIKMGNQHPTHGWDDYEAAMGFNIHDEVKRQYFEDLLIQFSRDHCENKLCNVLSEGSDYESAEIRDKYKFYAENFLKRFKSIRGYYESKIKKTEYSPREHTYHIRQDIGEGNMMGRMEKYPEAPRNINLPQPEKLKHKWVTTIITSVFVLAAIATIYDVWFKDKTPNTLTNNIQKPIQRNDSVPKTNTKTGNGNPANNNPQTNVNNGIMSGSANGNGNTINNH